VFILHRALHLAVFLLDKFPSSFYISTGDSLLTPTKIYSRTLLPVLWLGKVKAAAHITGGGLPGNISRVVPNNLRISLDATCWKVPEIFGWIADKVGDNAVCE
jgi:phosphoribosylformylglycinamidine cyclo-ligase